MVGLIVGQLAAVNRRHRNLAAQSSYNLGRIHAVAEMVAAGDPVDQVVQAVANELKDLLTLRSCRYDPSFADPPGPFIERHGEVSYGAIRWGFRTMGLPSKAVSLIIEHQARPLGRYVLLAQPGTRLAADQFLTAVVLADQAGAALAAEVRPTLNWLFRLPWGRRERCYRDRRAGPRLIIAGQNLLAANANRRSETTYETPTRFCTRRSKSRPISQRRTGRSRRFWASWAGFRNE